MLAYNPEHFSTELHQMGFLINRLICAAICSACEQKGSGERPCTALRTYSKRCQ